MDSINIINARSNNLKNISIEIPRNKLTVITGLSGSGKSSLAFETIHKEGQRRFLESITNYGKTFMANLEAVDVDQITGLTPTIAIDQKTVINNPRSTVGTITEVYDFLRILYAKIGVAHNPKNGNIVSARSRDSILEDCQNFKNGEKISIIAPILKNQKGEHRVLLQKYEHLGYQRIRVNNVIYNIDEKIPFDKNKANNIDLIIDRIVFKQGSADRLKDSLVQALRISGGSVIIATEKEEFYYSEKFYDSQTGENFPDLEPRFFSFNSPLGACKKCDGLGTLEEISEKSIITDETISLFDGQISRVFNNFEHLENELIKVYKKYKIDQETPIKNLPEKFRKLIFHGQKDEKFEGLVRYLKNILDEYGDYFLEGLIHHQICPVCEGDRLQPYSRAVTFHGKSIGQLCKMPLDATYDFFKKITLNKSEKAIGDKLLKEILGRLHFLNDVGVNYLNLNRSANTLSGGELQRIRLATQLGTSLSGVIYILDEPSIGLHQRDNEKLISTLKNLRDQNNTVIVVEHDEETMRAADHVIDIGPGSGNNGGEVVFAGHFKQLNGAKNSLTSDYIFKRKNIPIPTERRKSKTQLLLKGAHQHNIKNVNLKIPIGVFTCITGVSGSGKSTLIHDILIPSIKHYIFKGYPHKGNFKSLENVESIEDIIEVDQSPIGRTPKSIPLTYVGIFDNIRNLLASSNSSKLLGLEAGHFSFNLSKGRCETCEGSGSIRFEIPLLSDVYNICPDCNGKRYRPDVLKATYKGLNIDQILNLTVEQGLKFFENHRKIHFTLDTLNKVGLGYLRLGQPSPTLSGGEAQRIKLSRELSKMKKGKCIYVLDEPTTGLHFHDINMLINSLQELVNNGHSVVIIEHNLDVIKTADHVVDMGPDGGSKGGEVVAEGTPEDIAKNKNSLTGKFLKEYFKS
jgi:excinuclease ABC subunit A